jgi:hypothetical protein
LHILFFIKNIYLPGETLSDPIINTKLHRPPVDRNYVYRPHLLAQLDNHRGKPLTLVGRLRDQAELPGVLNSLYDLRLPILKVEVVKGE